MVVILSFVFKFSVYNTDLGGLSQLLVLFSQKLCL